jgi:hypothetical protein
LFDTQEDYEKHKFWFIPVHLSRRVEETERNKNVIEDYRSRDYF